MFNNLKLMLLVSLIIIHSCGSNDSSTRIPVSSNSVEAKELLHQAMKLNSISQGDKAKEKLLKAIELDPDFGFAYLMLSTFGTNTVKETDSYYDRAISLKDKLNDVEKCMLEVRGSYRENDLEKRMKYSKKILDLIPDNAFAHLRMAYTYWESADIENSRKYLLSSIEKDKYYSEPYGALIQNYMFYEPKSYEKAEKYANQILSLYKNESYHHVALGDVYRGQNKLEKAAEKYDDAYQTGTNNYFSAAKAGHAYTMIDPPEARKRFDQAVKDARTTNQKIGPEYAKIYTYLHEEEFQKAHSQLMKLKNNLESYDLSEEKKQSELSEILWHEYFIKSHTGEHDAAKIALKKQNVIDLAIAKKSKNERSVKNTEAGYLWAESHLEIMKGNYDEAKLKLKRLKRMRSNENNPTKLDGYHNLMGMASLMSGSPEKGVEYFDKVVDPSNIYFKYFNGLANKASGNIEKAKKLFQEVATHNFNGLNYTVVRNKAIKEIAKG